MFWRKRYSEESDTQPQYYGKGYACEYGHLSHLENDGICMACGDPIKPCVVRGTYLSFSPHLYPDEFVRWLP